MYLVAYLDMGRCEYLRYARYQADAPRFDIFTPHKGNAHLFPDLDEAKRQAKLMSDDPRLTGRITIKELPAAAIEQAA